jgi:hypothetical protein
MPIRTAHGTVIVIDAQTRQLRHVAMPAALPQTLANMGHLESAGYSMEPAANRSGFYFKRENLYLCAELRSDVLQCDRAAPGGWETFSLIEEHALSADNGDGLAHGFLRDYQLGNLKQAIAGLTKVIAHYPDNHTAQLHLGLARALLDPPASKPPKLFLQCGLATLWEADWLKSLLGDFFSAAEQDGAHLPSASHMVVVDHALNAEKALCFQQSFKSGHRILLIHIGDEGFVEDLSAYAWCHMVWRNYWSPILARQPNIRFFPLGYKSGFATEAAPPPAEARRHVWSFAGDPNKSSRPRMLEAMQRVPGGHMHLTTHFASTDALPTEAYRALLENTVFVPCPGGLSNLETFRVYEALEAGGIPLLERRPGFDYFRNLLGDHPMPTLADWAEAPELINRILATGATGRLQKSCTAWWRILKRTLRTDLAASIGGLDTPRY